MLKVLEKISNVKKTSSKFIYINPSNITFMEPIENEDGEKWTRIYFLAPNFYVNVYDSAESILKKLEGGK